MLPCVQQGLRKHAIVFAFVEPVCELGSRQATRDGVVVVNVLEMQVCRHVLEVLDFAGTPTLSPIQRR